MSQWVLRACVVGAVLVASPPALAGSISQHEGHQPAPSKPAVAPAPQPVPEKVLGWEPIRCWRQSSAGAVTVGEAFTVVLTCAVFEAENAQVVPDESRLGVASIQMAPFEILGGGHPPDVRRGSRRFFQYDYQLRIISPDAVGRDVNIPALSISYRIHSRVGAASTLEGRDLSYLMPMMPIKVLSLVPADAADIRDASEASLGAVESLRFRSSLFQVLALTFGALAGVMVVLALVPLVRSSPTVEVTPRQRVPDRVVLGRAADDLGEVQARATAEGWTDDLVARALGSIRLIGAAAIDRPISHKPLAYGAATPEGRLLVRHGTIRSTNVTISSSLTADTLGRAADSNPTRAFSTTRQHQIEVLQSALSTLTKALYSQQPSRDNAALEDSVRQSMTIARQIAKERNWWSDLRRGFGRPTGGQDPTWPRR